MDLSFLTNLMHNPINFVAGLGPVLNKATGMVTGAIATVSQMNIVFQMMFFALFIFLIYKLAQIFIRAIYVAVVAAIFPFFLVMIGVPIQLSTANIIFFVVVGVLLYLVYEKITWIVKGLKVLWKALKIIFLPFTAIGKFFVWLYTENPEAKSHKKIKKTHKRLKKLEKSFERAEKEKLGKKKKPKKEDGDSESEAEEETREKESEDDGAKGLDKEETESDEKEKGWSAWGEDEG